jgi:hypothetical protein
MERAWINLVAYDGPFCLNHEWKWETMAIADEGARRASAHNLFS